MSSLCAAPTGSFRHCGTAVAATSLMTKAFVVISLLAMLPYQSHPFIIFDVKGCLIFLVYHCNEVLGPDLHLYGDLDKNSRDDLNQSQALRSVLAGNNIATGTDYCVLSFLHSLVGSLRCPFYQGSITVPSLQWIFHSLTLCFLEHTNQR